ncbi:putative nucleic acid-binding Zn-ribbon protein [Rhizobium sp. BK377]|nr:phage tail tape measure protein [Rhizobium sp. BK377]MBB3461967.1 putative nucleic acid-binding Zn-ribbon protein [Rhizobium sp. BK377]
MNDINVALRLRLKNDLSREAPKAERDLKHIKQAADALGKAGGSNKLGRELAELRREAGQSERAVRNLDREARKLNAVSTNSAEREVRALGTAAKTAQKDLRLLERESRNLRGVDPGKIDRINKPAGALNRTMDMLKSSAGAAFGALVAFASVDNIIRGMEEVADRARKLDREIASVAVTAEMRTPQAIKQIGASNEKLSVRYGVDQTAVNDARKTFAAAGFGLDQQEAILDPTLKAAKAGDSTGETMAAAVIASQQALGVKNSEVPAALDMMAKGSKLGSFEVDAMAKNFPALATMYGGTGRSGLQGWAELIAAAQVVRMGAGTQDQAATNLENIISKLSSPDTVKNFQEKGVDLEKLKNKSIKNGTPYMMDVVDEVMRISGGNEFTIGELFGDMQAKQALAPLIGKRDVYNDFLKQIVGDSRGTVDADYDFVRNRPQEKADRREAAAAATGNKIGAIYGAVTDPIKDRVVGAFNGDYARQEEEYRQTQLRQLGPLELSKRIADLEARLSKLPPEKLDGVIPMMGAVRGQVKGQLEELKGAMSTLDGGSSLEARDERAAARGPSGWQRFLFGRAAQPGFDLKDQLGIDLRPAAEESMKGYNEGLASEGQKAAQEATSIADRIKAALGFTVSPTIAPNFMPPASTPTSLPKDKQSALQTPSSVKVAQYFPGGNARLAAMRAQREQNRAIRMASARSLSDTGGKLA